MLRLIILMTLGIYASFSHAELDINLVYLSQKVEQDPVLSNVLPAPDDQGLKGIELAIDDSNTTGRFLNHRYGFEMIRSDDPKQLIDDAVAFYEKGFRFFVLDLSAAVLVKLANRLPKDVLLFNATNPADSLRQHDCQKQIFHTHPSRAMLTDALAQWAKTKRLQEILLITGGRREDSLYADAMKRSMSRFGLSLVEELEWSFDTDLRRTAQKELPLFTQTDEYDLVVVADEAGDFGEYVPFNTWYPRPVSGTQGLTPVAWHRVVEQWGAAQLQSRFEKLSGRWMNGIDYSSWLAVRSIAEAVTQTNSNDPERIGEFILSPEFELAAFKGRKLTYRDWNNQIRQPIPLVHPRALVSQSPQAGFLHPINELDTLGFDRPEVTCATN